MSFRNARSVEDLQELTAGYDLVLTTDAPLARALSYRLDEPRLGQFATTPQMLAADDPAPRDKRTLFHELVAETDLGWKHAAHLLDDVLGAWEETGDLSSVTDYAPLDSAAAREVVSVVRAADSAHRAVAEYDLDPDLDVAVVGEDSFTALDRRLLPDDYDAVDPFGSGTVDLPEFHVFESATAIVNALVENVPPAAADRVGVVLDRGSDYPALVESAFESAGVPYHGGPGFADDGDVRTFLRLARAALARGETRLADLRPLLAALGHDPPVADERKTVADVDGDGVAPFREFRAAARAGTLGDALDRFEDWSGEDLAALRTELDALGVLDAELTDDLLDRVGYYLDHFEVPVDREREGVLLADAGAAAYVDRPVVFYLGLGRGWTRSVPEKPWIDRRARDREHLRAFQLLLQNGSDRQFLVQDSRAGEPVTPCLYFQDLLEEGFERFTDRPHVRHAGHAAGEGDGFAHRPVPDAPDPEPVETISQSSLNSFVNSPRDYFFGELLDSPERDYRTKGTLFHDFAEFFVNHRNFARDHLDAVVDRMVAELRPHVREVDLPLVRSEARAGVETIVAFLEENWPDDENYDRYEPRDWGNAFAEQFDRELDSTVAEQWFEDPAFGGKGLVDLVQSPTHLLDYKSGRRKTPGKVAENAAVDEPSDTPDYQAPMYLAHHRREVPDEQLEFTFVHFLEAHDDWVRDDVDLDDLTTTVTAHPTTFAEFAGTRTAFDALRADVVESNARRKTLEKLGFEAYREFFEDHEFPDAETRDELLASETFDAFVDLAVDEVGDYSYVRNGCRSAFGEIDDLRGVDFYEEDLDAFEAFLDEQLDALREYRETRFPVGDPNLDRVDHRDLLLTDE